MNFLSPEARAEIIEIVKTALREVLAERPASATDDPDRFLSPKDLEDKGLGTAAHWRALARAKRVPHVMLGAHVRFKWADVQAYLAAAAPADELERRRGRR